VNVTFFSELEDGSSNNFSTSKEIPEDSILGGGDFTKDNIGELLSCFRSGHSTESDNLWLLSTSFSETLSTIDDDSLKGVATHWAEESSWGGTDANENELANHLFELKCAYSSSSKRIWVFFE